MVQPQEMSLPREGRLIELLERQKKLTANQWKLICTANVADLLDFFDFFLIGYVLAFITKEWQLTYWEGAVILLASGIGAVPGAFFWGWVADKIGRRKVFILTTLNVAIATGILALTGPGRLGRRLALLGVLPLLLLFHVRDPPRGIAADPWPHVSDNTVRIASVYIIDTAGDRLARNFCFLG